MSSNPDDNTKNPTQFFTVAGGAFVREGHADKGHHLPERSDTHQPETGVAGLWLVFYAVLFGISLITSGGAAKLIEMAAFAVK